MWLGTKELILAKNSARIRLRTQSISPRTISSICWAILQLDSTQRIIPNKWAASKTKKVQCRSCRLDAGARCYSIGGSIVPYQGLRGTKYNTEPPGVLSFDLGHATSIILLDALWIRISLLQTRRRNEGNGMAGVGWSEWASSWGRNSIRFTWDCDCYVLQQRDSSQSI